MASDTVNKHGFGTDGKSCFDLRTLNACRGALEIGARGDHPGEASDAFETALAHSIEGRLGEPREV